ncbi:MAG: hypothetical protein IJH63_10185 [Methanobrevibacter sp.]|nr:hypothetical protein [Methanosphaera sp.]MBR0371067.1 hypothetical protein [Methanobrevibacter sp.]
MKNISVSASGKFYIRKYVDGKEYNFGSYDSLEEAIDYRDYFESKGWSNCLNERLNYSTSKFIQKIGDKYKVEKCFGNHESNNRKRYSYGTFDTLGEAILHRDKCIKNNWDESLRPDNHLKYIQQKRGKYWIIKDEVIYGMFDNVDDAILERDLLIQTDFDWDALCEGIDETINGEIGYLQGKTLKTTFQKHNHRNDVVMWNNSKRYKPRVNCYW